MAYNVAKANSGSPSASRVNLTPTSSNGKEPEVETPGGVVDKMEGVEKDDDDDDDDDEQPNFKESVKIPAPDKFHGERKLLDDYIIQLEMHFTFNEDKFDSQSQKCIFAASFLRGIAMTWIKPYLFDYYQNSHKSTKMMVMTRNIFGGWEGFKEEIRKMFGNFDEQAEAVRKLFGLRQSGSAMDYSAMFQRHGSKTGWDSVALMHHYKRGLKPALQEELIRSGKQYSDIISMIEDIVTLDNRMHEFKREQGQGRRDDRPRGGRDHNQQGRRHDGGNRWRNQGNQNYNCSH